MASKASSESNSGARHRTGTFEFIAIEVLERDGPHSYRHDLESFFYVLPGVCIMGNESKNVLPANTLVCTLQLIEDSNT